MVILLVAFSVCVWLLSLGPVFEQMALCYRECVYCCSLVRCSARIPPLYIPINIYIYSLFCVKTKETEGRRGPCPATGVVACPFPTPKASLCSFKGFGFLIGFL